MRKYCVPRKLGRRPLPTGRLSTADASRELLQRLPHFAHPVASHSHSVSFASFCIFDFNNYHEHQRPTTLLGSRLQPRFCICQGWLLLTYYTYTDITYVKSSMPSVPNASALHQGQFYSLDQSPSDNIRNENIANPSGNPASSFFESPSCKIAHCSNTTAPNLNHETTTFLRHPALQLHRHAYLCRGLRERRYQTLCLDQLPLFPINLLLNPSLKPDADSKAELQTRGLQASDVSINGDVVNKRAEHLMG